VEDGRRPAALSLWLRSGPIQIGARFIYEFLSLRNGRVTHGLDFAFGYNAAFHKLSNHWAQWGATPGHASSDPTN